MGPVFWGGWQSGRAFWLRGILLVGGWGGEGVPGLAVRVPIHVSNVSPGFQVLMIKSPKCRCELPHQL